MKRSSDLARILAILQYLQNKPNPAGIVHNKTNEVIYRNPSSRSIMERWYTQFPDFSPPRNTSELQSQIQLRRLAAKVKRLPAIEQLPSKIFFVQEYILMFKGIGDVVVRDKFYRYNFACQTYRIFENITFQLPKTLDDQKTLDLY